MSRLNMDNQAISNIYFYLTECGYSGNQDDFLKICEKETMKSQIRLFNNVYLTQITQSEAQKFFINLLAQALKHFNYMHVTSLSYTLDDINIYLSCHGQALKKYAVLNSLTIHGENTKKGYMINCIAYSINKKIKEKTFVFSQ